VRAELTQSKAEIERRLGRPVRHFAFPNEAATDTLRASVATAGYRTACGGGPATDRACGIKTLRRLGSHEGASGETLGFDEDLLRLWLSRAPGNKPG
jgi:hypothetical protein